MKKCFRVYTTTATARKCKAGGHSTLSTTFTGWMYQPWTLCPSYLHLLQSICLVSTCLWLDMQLQRSSTQMQPVYHCNFCTDWCVHSSNATKARRDHGQRHSYPLSRIWNHPLPTIQPGKITKAHYYCTNVFLQHLHLWQIKHLFHWICDENWEKEHLRGTNMTSTKETEHNSCWGPVSVKSQFVMQAGR